MEIASHEQQIRKRAYAIWEGEGRPAGRADDHWLRAEAEIAKTAGVSGKTAAAAAAQPGSATVCAPKRAAAAAKRRDPAGVSALPARPQRRRPKA